jgi:hypothetical protein
MGPCVSWPEKKVPAGAWRVTVARTVVAVTVIAAVSLFAVPSRTPRMQSRIAGGEGPEVHGRADGDL